MQEEYKIFFEDYEISNLGNCRRKLKNGTYKIINGSINNRGYRYVQVNRNNKRINFLFHQQVAKYFIGDRNGLDTDHIDRNKLNNCVNNLRFITHKENLKNTDKYLVNIEEDDPKKRAIIRAKKYAENNKEYVLQKKQEYYLKNKDKWILITEKNRNDRVDYECGNCSIITNIKRKSFKARKTDLCRVCTSLKNLKINQQD
jgi:hypothetical protein